MDWIFLSENNGRVFLLEEQLQQRHKCGPAQGLIFPGKESSRLGSGGLIQISEDLEYQTKRFRLYSTGQILEQLIEAVLGVLVLEWLS